MSTSTTAETSADRAAPTTKTFADFGVHPVICESLAEVGITSPFPIQEMTLPLALTGADIIGQARTGTGKTLGFGLPLIQRIDTAAGLQALVIVPTRELCLQVAEDLAQAGKGKGVKVVAVYGGKAMQPQIDALEDGAHLVVGTPGRLLDLSRRGHLDLSSCAGLVLDEADEMLDLGFLPDVEALIEQTAETRQTLLFSATMPSAIVSLARRYMIKPTFMRADVEQVNIAPKTRQFFFSCHRMDKPAVVARILQTPDRGLCLVFCRTKRMADILAEELRERDVPAQAIHSDLRQEARERVMQKFRDGKVTVLCATEVAARGLDIDDVTHVVNYDCPDDEKMYLHRIGRTGRAGADGVAITFAVWNELPRLEMIRRELDIDDPIHEVFSTSPLLDELFDLPVREARTKVPSPPQARSATTSRTHRRAEKDRDDPSTERTPAKRPAKSPAKRSAESAGPRSATSTEGEEETTRTRRRTRTRTRPADDDRRGGTDDRGDSGTASPSEDGSDRRSTKPTTTSEQASGDGRRAAGRTRGGAEDSDTDEGTGGGRRRTTTERTRTRGGRAGRDDRAASPDTADDTAADDTATDDTAAGDTAAGDGGRGQGPRAGGDQRRGDESRRDDDTRSQSRKGGRGKGRDSRGRGGRDGGRNGRDSGRNGRDSGRSGRDSGRSGRDSGRSTRRTVDHEQARGEGKPRLARPLEVQHLP